MSERHPTPVLSLAILPKTKADQEKLGVALQTLTAEDPTIRVTAGKQAGEVIIGCMGELHLEIIVDRLKTEFGVEAMLGRAEVIYYQADNSGMLLEPIMRVEVTVPNEPVAGGVGGDLLRRRGQIQGLRNQGGTTTIAARVPLSEMFGYAAYLRQRTQGRATYTLTFDRYEPVRGHDGTDADPYSFVMSPLTPRPGTNDSAIALPEPGE